MLALVPSDWCFDDIPGKGVPDAEGYFVDLDVFFCRVHQSLDVVGYLWHFFFIYHLLVEFINSQLLNEINRKGKGVVVLYLLVVRLWLG
jgi:hypothetical protein